MMLPSAYLTLSTEGERVGDLHILTHNELSTGEKPYSLKKKQSPISMRVFSSAKTNGNRVRVVTIGKIVLNKMEHNK